VIAMMREETAQRIAVALERIADQMERGQAGAVPAPLLPGERVVPPGGGYRWPATGAGAGSRDVMGG
jgi:hypothetical protein